MTIFETVVTDVGIEAEVFRKEKIMILSYRIGVKFYEKENYYIDIINL